MKMRNIPLLIAATAVATITATQTGVAQSNTNLVPATVRLTCVSTNKSGDLVYEHVGTLDIIKECTSDMGITNLAGLSLVYNRSNTSLQVVRGTNQTLVCTPLSFGDGLTLSNTNGTVVELQKFVFVETNTVASGSIAATERIFPGTTNRPPFFTLIGRLNYTEPASGTNSPEICHGSLFVSSFFEHDEGNGDKGDHGETNSTAQVSSGQQAQ